MQKVKLAIIAVATSASVGILVAFMLLLKEIFGG